MKWFDTQEEELIRFIRTSGFLYELRRCAIAFAILVPVGFVLGWCFPAARDQMLALLLGEIRLTSEVSYTAMEALNNGLTACGASILYGVVPFAYLPALALGSNALLLGVMAAWYLHNGYSLALYLAAVLPHSVFEVPAMVLSFAAGMYLCGEITRRCQGDKSGAPLMTTLCRMVEVYLLLVFPVLAAAALTEVFVTPRLVNLFF